MTTLQFVEWMYANDIQPDEFRSGAAQRWYDQYVQGMLAYNAGANTPTYTGGSQWPTATIPGPTPAPAPAPAPGQPVMGGAVPLQYVSGTSLLPPLAPALLALPEGINEGQVMANAAKDAQGLGDLAKKLVMSLAGSQIATTFGQSQSNLANQNLVGGRSMNVHPTIIAMRLVGQAFAYSGDEINTSNFTLAGQGYGRRVLERLKSILTLGQQVPEYLEGLGLNDSSAELVEALLVDFDAMVADGTILVPEPRRGGETRSALFEQLNFLHFNLNNGNAWLTDNQYGNGRSPSRNTRSYRRR